MSHQRCYTRRQFMGSAAAAAVAAPAAAGQPTVAELRGKALVAITLDLEMSRNFPAWETTHWDYEKGNLNDETKRYAVEACRRIRAAGGVAHCFAVGRVFEQEDVSWLRDIARAGHAVGNHTYDHVNVQATRAEDIQHRFRRCPWLIEGQTPAQAIRKNVELCTAAMRNRIGIAPAGFRTPGGFQNGLRDHPTVQQMLQDVGFTWVSSLYPRHDIGRQVTDAMLASIVEAQRQAQPFAYPRGLVEIPMSPISDIGAFRTGRWPLDSFLRAIRMSLEWCIENRAVFDFLSHPSCMYVVDPQFRTVEMICDIVRRAGNRALIVDLNAIARRVRG